jgi:cysteinyl-tRNA synthetase
MIESPAFFYNTLSQKKEIFIPLKNGEVSMYTCGPTVYSYAHIGNFRTFIFEDLLRRYLKMKGYKVTQVMNITDVDDKTIKNSLKEGVSLGEYTQKYEKAFFEDLEALRIEKAEYYPRATEHITEMIELIKRLQKNGITYEKDGSTYFRISEYNDYGKLSKIDFENVISGSRYDSDEYEKEDVRDFVLWKKTDADSGETTWDSPFGKGRPGWHIECSAMSMKYLGESFDIHTGGVDNIFPHHENEIA